MQTGIRCRRRPKRKPCRGEIHAFLNEDTGAIQWNCFICGDNGFIYDWKNTNWDMRFSELIPVRLYIEEKDLIMDETSADPDLTNRLQTTKQVSDAVVVYYTLEELEDLLGYIAAEANHCNNPKVQNILDLLYRKIDDILDSYGNLKNCLDTE